ncbi:hypothetical protein ROT00_05095 [Agromyces mediolanus]|uniref:hypothetical protein n=1 Tax=Agromyces mediolanus TaxID=41986 RepID=UPI003836448B
MRKRAFAGLAGALALGFTVGVSAPAQAGSNWVTGEVRTTGGLVQYATEYYHNNYGGMTMNLTQVPPCGGYTALGLRFRASSTSQYTDSTVWTTPALKAFTKGGVTALTKGYYAFNARLSGAACGNPHWWGDTFTY